MFHKLLALCGVVLFAGICSLHAEDSGIGYLEAIKAEAAPVIGQSYYLRHCLMHEHGIHETTNYWRGKLEPINTKVTLVSLGSKKMVLKVEETGEGFAVENVEKYSRKTMDEIARNMLTRTPIPIEKFGDVLAREITSGQPSLNMTKEQLIMARGYPPAHKTPSLDNDIWVYWDTRMGYVTYAFEKGILVAGARLKRNNR